MRVIGMDHIVVNVSDIDEALEFYGGVLGLEVLRLDQFRRGEVGFVSVRLSGETVIDLQPSDTTPAEPVNIDHSASTSSPRTWRPSWSGSGLKVWR